jgi:hypothetical protein
MYVDVTVVEPIVVTVVVTGMNSVTVVVTVEVVGR